MNSEDIEELGTDRTINDSLDLMRIVGPPPFVPGAHLVNATWVRGMWERLLQVFRAQFALTGTSVDLYFTEKNQDLHVPGKIFFHLVEDKHGTHPFAFMLYTMEKEPGYLDIGFERFMRSFRNEFKKRDGFWREFRKFEDYGR